MTARFQELAPGPRGALVLGLAALLLLVLGRAQGAPQASNPVFALVAVLAAGALGFVVGQAPAALFRASSRELALALGASLLAVLVVLAWMELGRRFQTREWLWLAGPAEGLKVLPGLLPAGLLRRPGAALLGFALLGLVVALTVGLYGAVALLYVPMVALPVELWLLARHHDGSLPSLALAGALGAALSVLVARPELLALDGLWSLAGAMVSAALGGALTGALVYALAEALRPRLGLMSDGGGAEAGGWA